MNDKIFVHGGMKYKCEACGKEWWMMLEKGLEEPGPDHKPVPFIIMCPRCGGPAHDISGLVKLPKEEILPYGVSYFSNSKKSDCGKPVYYVSTLIQPEAEALFEKLPWRFK